jgi:prepilin-type N-terminal cleavage/methylation domain-containing protein
VRSCEPRCSVPIPTARCPDAISRPGFTLIEVLVALAVGSLVLLACRAVFESLADGADRILSAAATVDGAANGMETLRDVVGRVESATALPGSVAGDERQVRLETWCTAAAAWLERCSVTLGFTPVDGGSSLVATGLPTGRVMLLSGFRAGAFRYLADARAGGVIHASWPWQVATPLALLLVLDGDTLVLPIGDRG